MSIKMIFRTGSVVVAALAVTNGVYAQQSNTVQKDGNTIFTVPKAKAMAGSATGPDFVNAKPMPLPQLNLPPVAAPLEAEAIQPDQSWGSPGMSAGEQGNGKPSSKKIPVPRPMAPEAGDAATVPSSEEIQPKAYGTGGVPYNTSRVDLSGTNPSGWHPYRATGKLYFKDGNSTYVCTASLIKRGVIVTAAHCVASFGNKRFYSDWQFVPAMSGSTAPYGVWKGTQASVKTSYYDGTDACYQKGVVCANDVAVIRLDPQSSAFPGTRTGWYGYGYNNWGFIRNTTLINQLGYPVSHDNGVKMQHTDSQGSVNASMSGNTLWGSGQTGGSSGGPELANLGVSPVLNGTTPGSASTRNVVVGVTSWGYTDPAQKLQGASPFTTNNIVSLITAICGSPLVPACQ